jgi:hypothetical protein
VELDIETKEPSEPPLAHQPLSATSKGMYAWHLSGSLKQEMVNGSKL